MRKNHQIAFELPKKFSAFLLITALLIFSGCAQQSRNATSPAPEPVQKGEISKTVSVEGEQREYLLYVPETYDGKTPMPLILNFHGSGSNPQKQFESTDFKQLAESKGFIVASPAGKFESYGMNSWNTSMNEDGVDDVQMIKDIISQVSSSYSIDTKRIYATGFSGGARMTCRAACELSDILAAVAPVSGVQFPEQCDISRAMPVITFHGKKDLVNHYSLQENSRAYWTSGVEDSIKGWVETDECRTPPQTEQISDMVTKVTWNACKDDAEVVFYSIEDGGHTWPGSPVINKAFWAGKTNTDIVASELIWTFFQEHPLP